MVTVVLCNGLKLSYDTEKENVYISFLKEPCMSVSIISKGRKIMSKIRKDIKFGFGLKLAKLGLKTPLKT